MSDIIQITVPNPIDVTVTTGVLGLDRSDATNTRILTSDGSYAATDDVVILNASAGPVAYTMPADPTDNETLTIVASDISNPATVNWNSKSFQDDAEDYIFFAEWEPLKVRYISSIDKWVRI